MIYDDYDKYDAAADAAHDAWCEFVQPYLDRLVDAEIERRTENMTEEELDEFCEDELRDELEDQFRDEAEEQATDDARDSQPCCNDFHCPCGNSNNYRG